MHAKGISELTKKERHELKAFLWTTFNPSSKQRSSQANAKTLHRKQASWTASALKNLQQCQHASAAHNLLLFETLKKELRTLGVKMCPKSKD